MARKLSFFSVGVEGELVFVCLCGPGRVLRCRRIRIISPIKPPSALVKRINFIF